MAAISFDKLDLETGMEVADPKGKLTRLFHPWSILAWQLAGKKGLEILNGGKGMAERDTAPAENVMTDLLAVPNAEGVSSLILLDEVLMYARQTSSARQGLAHQAAVIFSSADPSGGEDRSVCHGGIAAGFGIGPTTRSVWKSRPR